MFYPRMGHECMYVLKFNIHKNTQIDVYYLYTHVVHRKRNIMQHVDFLSGLCVYNKSAICEWTNYDVDTLGREGSSLKFEISHLSKKKGSNSLHWEISNIWIIKYHIHIINISLIIKEDLTTTKLIVW